MLVEITRGALEQLPGVCQAGLPGFMQAKVLGESPPRLCGTQPHSEVQGSPSLSDTNCPHPAGLGGEGGKDAL